MSDVNETQILFELQELSERYSQSDLSEKLYISQSYISMMLSGKRQPSKSIIGRIKRLYCGTETQTAKWEDSHGSCSVTVSLSSRYLNPEEKHKLAKIIAYYASSYLKSEIDGAAGISTERPIPLP